VADASVAIIGGGVVGAAVAYTLARRGVAAVLLEAEGELAYGASGTNSGILHTGFDSKPGELETRLILRAGELRPSVLEDLAVPVVQCGARLQPHTGDERAIVERVAAGAHANGVEVVLADDGTLEVPGESLTDPVEYTRALAGAAEAAGTEIRTNARVGAIRREADGLVLEPDGGGAVECTVAVNCAGLCADEVARLAGDDSFGIYPRKGEFFVFEPLEPLERILLPVPTERTKGVLVFPTVDGKVIAGPTAVDGEDKGDWTVRPEAQAEVMAKAGAMWPPLEGAEPIASYAGLRPAGRDGANYWIAHSRACPGLVNVAAIRSTGLTASLGIGEYVAALVAEYGLELAPDRPLPPGRRPGNRELPWWRRAGQLHAAVT
jgi:glycerol-3-phosphate dehydrogenase